LHVQQRSGKDYYTYRSPLTKKVIVFGYDKAKAFAYAEAANAEVAAHREARSHARLAIKRGGVDGRGLLDEEVILRRAMLYDSICGIYFLLDGEKIVYVGQSISLLSRVAKHWQEGAKPFNRVFFIECAQAELSHLEALYIDKFKPQYNASKPWVDPGSVAWDASLRHLLGDAVHSKN
jgi:hypothetical protein